MTTTDTDALTEKIEAALWGVTQVYDAPHGHGTEVGVHAPVHKVVAAVLPIVAEEVRKAKAEALREMQEHHEREADKAQTITARGIHLAIADGARKRATKYETGVSDEHR